MNDEIFESKDASQLAEYHYTEYGTYVNETRALASVYDGLKLVERRIIFEANKLPDKLTKSTNLVGNAIKLHPHGSSSIYGSIVTMATPTCNLRLFDTKGNWGGWGFGAAADRYTECKLSALAKFIYCQFVDYAPMEEGEIPGTVEPKYLPCLIPYGLIEGTSGMGIGLAANVCPLNPLDLVDFYIEMIKENKIPDQIVRPNFGSAILWMEDSECSENVRKYSGSFMMSSIVNQESDTIFVIESIYGKSIDKVLKKLSKYIDTEKVDFRNESTSIQRYVFEIMDNSVDPAKFKEDLQNATYKKSSFNRIFDIDGKSVYCSLSHVIKKQMEVLNKAIDLKIRTELESYKYRRLIFEGIEFFKENNVFNDITKLTSEELVERMMSYNKCSEEVCWEIIKKPITYLTRSHENELIDLSSKIEELENHNRQEYLLEKYMKLKEMLLEYYKGKSFTILKSQLLQDPRAVLIKEEDGYKLQISSKGRGVKFKNALYIISESGTIYKRSVSAMSKRLINLDIEEPVIAIASDNAKFISLHIKKNENQGIVFNTDSYKWDKKWINLSEDQKVVEVREFWNDSENLRNQTRSKICKPYWFDLTE